MVKKPHKLCQGGDRGFLFDHNFDVNPGSVMGSSCSSDSLDTEPPGFLYNYFRVNPMHKNIKKTKGSKAGGWDNIPNEALHSS